MLGGIVFCVICIAFAGLLWLTRPAAPVTLGSGGLAVLRSAMPPLLLGWCLFLATASSPLVDTLRLHVKQLEVATGSPAPMLRVGGGSETSQDGSDDVEQAIDWTGPDLFVGPGTGDALGEPQADYVVANLTGGAGGTPPSLDVKLSTVSSSDTIVLTMYEIGDGKRHFVGATPIGSGSALCFAACGTNAAHWWHFDGKGVFRSDDASSSPFALQKRLGLVAGRIRPWGPESAIYPARRYFPESRHGGRSILFEEDGQWYALLLDPGAQAKTGAGLSAPAGPMATWHSSDHTALAALKSLHVHIGRVALNRFATKCDGGGTRAALGTIFTGENPTAACFNTRFREQRAFWLKVRSGHDNVPDALLLQLDRQDAQSLGALTAPRARLTAAPDPEDARSFTLARLRGGLRPGSILGGAIDNFSSGLLRVMEGGGQDRTAVSAGSACHPGADEVCAGTPAQAIRFRVDRMRVPWMLLALCAGCAIAFHAASGRAWEHDRVDGIVLAVAQMLLALRTVFAVEGTLMDTALEWRLLYGEVAVAMVTLPCILMALRRRQDMPNGVTLALLGFAIAAVGAVRLWLGPLDTIPLALAVLAIAALALRLGLSIVPRGSLDTAMNRSIAFVARHGLMLVAILVAVRVLSVLFGFKERVGYIAVSTLYLPPLLVGLASLIAQADATPGTRLRSGLTYLAAVLIAIVGPASVARDIGFAFVYLWPILGVATWRGLVWWREVPPAERPKLFAWIAPAPLLAGGSCLALLLIGVMWQPPNLPDGTDRPASETEIASRLRYAEAIDENDIRLLAVANPDAVPLIGTKAASQQMEQTIHLVERTRTTFGIGYAQPSNLPRRQDSANFGVLREVHLTDNVSAVHLMAPFGRAAGAALILVLGVAAIGTCAGQRAHAGANGHSLPARWRCGRCSERPRT